MKLIKILVTGATGFIGNHVIKELLKTSNYEIIATSIDLANKIKKFEWCNEVEYIQSDLNESKENYFNFFKKPEKLIHLAWEGLPNYNELFHIERNLFSNYYFLKNIIINGLRDVNIIGTCFEYGLKEGCLSEDLETNPVLPYAIAKDTLRRLIEVLGRKYSFNFKWIRPFYTYGEGQNPKSLLPQLIKALDENKEFFNMTGGEQLRDYIPVEKLAEYIVKISQQNEKNLIINCCSGNPISIRTFIENFLKEKKKRIKLNLGYYPYPNYVPMAFWGDIAKLNRILSTYDNKNKNG